MKKKDREIIFNKYGGNCAYCGCVLEKSWHVDELLPCRRRERIVLGHWRGREWVATKTIPDGYDHPERLHIDNQMPSCASCNINKHSMSLDEFRHSISHFVVSLNRDSTQYKIAKRYGLIHETVKPIVFYFEKQDKEDEA